MIAWEESPGYLVPKTTKVAGFCNKNVAADESEWQWEVCTVAVPWEDLWYAVRGGGGGSYGVVVGLTYQLHPRRFRYDIAIDRQAYGSCGNLTGNALLASPGCREVQGKILGGTEYNHVNRDEFGPLKSDHSKLCPVTLTHAEKEEQCLSLQEGVWGTDGLARLEAIKAKIDPQGLFQCQKCVGFKGPVRDQ